MIDSVHGTYSCTFQTAGQIRFRLRSRSSQTSGSWFLKGRFGDPGRFSGRALSPSLRCSSCRTSSVFSFRRSPGSSEAFTMLEENRSIRELFMVIPQLRKCKCLREFKQMKVKQSHDLPHLSWCEASMVLWRICCSGDCQWAIWAHPFPIIRVIFHYVVGSHAILKNGPQ